MKLKILRTFALFIAGLSAHGYFLGYGLGASLGMILINTLIFMFCLKQGIKLDSILNDVARLEKNKTDIETFE